ncbi:MAG: dihydrofolate reductase family protein [Pseudobacter sp.]|uniref:dihydrofolate reductase family protein n=1 Tax=Pseudobacter sp. TaxID=2045420 RepID=UPI003F810C3E
MRKLTVFNFTTLNGFYKGPEEDISWNQHGPQENEHAENGLQSGNILLFGRRTYDMMAGFWPTDQARAMMPSVAEGMNKAEKLVVSHSLTHPSWNNSRVLSGNLEKNIRELKQSAGKDITILGSGSIVAQLTDLGLIDGYQIMINPVALGAGTTLFQGIKRPLNLKLVNSSVLSNGILVLDYEPV